MPKYRVKFKTEVQVDGWTDWRDTEYSTRTETVTVVAKNVKSARIQAVKKSHGYLGGWGYHQHRWWSGNIVSVTRVKIKK